MIQWHIKNSFTDSFSPCSFPYLDQATATLEIKAKTTDHILQCGVDTTGYISTSEAETTDHISIDIGKWTKFLGLNMLPF